MKSSGGREWGWARTCLPWSEMSLAGLGLVAQTPLPGLRPVPAPRVSMNEAAPRDGRPSSGLSQYHVGLGDLSAGLATFWTDLGLLSWATELARMPAVAMSSRSCPGRSRHSCR